MTASHSRFKLILKLEGREKQRTEFDKLLEEGYSRNVRFPGRKVSESGNVDNFEVRAKITRIVSNVLAAGCSKQAQIQSERRFWASKTEDTVSCRSDNADSRCLRASKYSLAFETIQFLSVAAQVTYC